MLWFLAACIITAGYLQQKQGCVSLCFTRCCFCSAYVTDSQTHWAAVPLICCHSLHFFFFFLSKCLFAIILCFLWSELRFFIQTFCLHVGWMWISDDFAVFSFTKSKITFKTINLFSMLHTYLSAVYCHQQIYVLRSVGHRDFCLCANERRGFICCTYSSLCDAHGAFSICRLTIWGHEHTNFMSV